MRLLVIELPVVPVNWFFNNGVESWWPLGHGISLNFKLLPKLPFRRWSWALRAGSMYSELILLTDSPMAPTIRNLLSVVLAL